MRIIPIFNIQNNDNCTPGFCGAIKRAVRWVQHRVALNILIFTRPIADPAANLIAFSTSLTHEKPLERKLAIVCPRSVAVARMESE